MSKVKKKSDLAEFFAYFRPHMGLFLMDMACATLASAIDLAFPYVSRLSMTTLLPEKLFTTFFAVIAIIVAAYILKGVCYYFITCISRRTCAARPSTTYRS